MSYTKIISGLYLGSYNDVINNSFNKENIDIIINVAKECKKIIQNPNIDYFYYSYEDSLTNSISDSFDEISDLIHKYLTQNKNVFIHCMAGKSRSASFVIIYLMKYLKYTLEDAYQYVNNLRDIYPNLGFIEQMMEYELKTTYKSTLNYDQVVIDNIHSSVPTIPKDKIKEIYIKSNKDINLTVSEIFSI